MAVVTTLFFMWGFVTALNDILIPHLKSIFDLNYTEVMLVQFSFFSAYFVFSLPSSKLLDKLGYKQTMLTGLLAMATGTLLFIPAALAPSFVIFLAALIIIAAGMTALQVSANPYVAVLGPPRTASSRLNLTQAFNSLGTFIAPLLGSILILGSVPKTADELRRLSPEALHTYRVLQASTVKLPYFLIAVTLVLLALAIWRFPLPAILTRDVADADSRSSIWKHPHLIYGAIAIFVYVGAEVAIGSFLVNYFMQRDIGNMSQQLAGQRLALYWGSAMVGRFIGSALLQKIRTSTLLAIFAVGAGGLVAASMASFGAVAVWTIIFVGFFNSIMFPSIFTLAIEGLGPLTSKGSGLLIAAIIGGAIIPEFQGILADHIGIHRAFFLPAICYLYLFFFAVYGSKQRSSPAQRRDAGTA